MPVTWSEIEEDDPVFTGVQMYFERPVGEAPTEEPPTEPVPPVEEPEEEQPA